MTIQVQQTFPHCARCGIMLHFRRPRIAALDTDERRVLFCSELCRDEYAETPGLADRGAWQEAAVESRR